LKKKKIDFFENLTKKATRSHRRAYVGEAKINERNQERRKSKKNKNFGDYFFSLPVG
jgi:hypothetical protein